MKTSTIIGLTFKMVAAIIMVWTLYFKFTAHPESVYIFSKLGLEPHGRISVGLVELIASILILYPDTSWFGALMGIGLMAGALFFHLTGLGIIVQDDAGTLFLMALTVLISCTVVLYLEKENIPFINSKKIAD